MQEIWKAVPGYEGKYEVSNLGRVKGLPLFKIRRDGSSYSRKERFLKPAKMSKSGMLFISIHIYDDNGNKERKNISVHRMVCMAFHGMPKKGYEVNHKDGCNINNTPENLEWVTRKENLDHQRVNKLFRHSEESPYAKLTSQQVFEIRKKHTKLKYGDLSIIAREHGVSAASIRDLLMRKTWKHV